MKGVAVGMQREKAETLAIAALSFIAGEPESLARFLALSGIGPATRMSRRISVSSALMREASNALENEAAGFAAAASLAFRLSVIALAIVNVMTSPSHAEVCGGAPTG